MTAPDLLGHGCARRGSVYTIAALVEELRPLLLTSRESGDPPYDVIVGHSLGGVVTAVLLPLLKSARSVQVVLVDPPLEADPEALVYYRNFFSEMVSHPKTPEVFLQENPLWTKEDAVIANAGMQLCGVEVVQAILDQNVPWSFSHHLSMAPDNVQVTVLAADPSKWWLVKEEDLQAYPHVKAKTVWGASHMIHLEDPGAVLNAALGGEGKDNEGGESARDGNVAQCVVPPTSESLQG